MRRANRNILIVTLAAATAALVTFLLKRKPPME
jgi:hypothetical protein